MVIGTVRIPLTPERRVELLEVLRSVKGPIETQPGCAACHIYEEQCPESAVVLVARWESQAALEAHIRSEVYRRVLGAIELAAGPPEVCFEEVGASEGLELVGRLRGRAGINGALLRNPSR